MHRLRTEDYKTLLQSYQLCLGTYFPDIKLECLEAMFVINEQGLQYDNIEGIILTDLHLIIKMNNCKLIHLPINQKAEYYVRVCPDSESRLLFKLWKNDMDN